MNMLHPNYVELMKVVNQEVEEGEEPIISSRYSVVMAAAKRARQIVLGAEPLVEADSKVKPLSVAVNELWQDKISILPNDGGDLEDYGVTYQSGKIVSVSEDDLNEDLEPDVSEDEELDREELREEDDAIAENVDAN
ncbi:DNA-directed RNA polymerase subunit omega [Lachnoclostridium sp. Marseille-P6806]|uniref:DNA-directed RNA polymerase subunit omega n=1 Tax=Lachnoclostridium sp. Marseille-P6806 TaxID=2364793 RepID=UPI001F5FD254|nr:DNA-directed RNA polymerase subunit omega [Lachnoclostridium sp. Marseille-P6806]